MFIEQAMDTKAKAAQQTPLLAQKSNTHYPLDYKPLKSEESKDQKNFKAKKNHHLFVASSNGESGNGGQLSQALGCSFKKCSCFNREGQ